MALGAIWGRFWGQLGGQLGAKLEQKSIKNGHQNHVEKSIETMRCEVIRGYAEKLGREGGCPYKYYIGPSRGIPDTLGTLHECHKGTVADIYIYIYIMYIYYVYTVYSLFRACCPMIRTYMRTLLSRA